MKTYIIIFLAIAGSWAACKKETNSQRKNNRQDFIHEIEKIAETHKKAAADNAKANLPSLRKIFIVIGADVSGFLSIGNAATKFVEGVGLNVNEYRASIIAAAAAAAAGASADAGSTAYVTNHEWTTGVSGNLNVPANIANPYNYAGVRHNNGLDLYAANFSSWTNFDTVNITAMTQLFMNQVAPGSGAYVYPGIESDFIQTLNLMNMPGDFNHHVFLNALYNSNLINNLQYSVINSYFNTIEMQSSVQGINNVTTQFENTVINGNLDEKDRLVLLGALAVGRYSTAYWSFVYTPPAL